MSDRFHRRSIRLKGYDYRQAGAYYVTVCTHERVYLFGQVTDGTMRNSPMGDIVQRCWDAIPEHMPHVDVGEFVVMPNHVHGIVNIRERDGDMRGGAMDGAVGVWARHDVPGMGALDAPHMGPLDAPGIGAGDTHGSIDNTPDPAPDDPGTELPGGSSRSFANAHGQRTRARQDAPLREPQKPPGIPRGALGQIVASYKSAVTRMAYRDGLIPRGSPIWQRNYYERIIRNDGEWARIAKYIQDNPKNWKGDRFNWP